MKKRILCGLLSAALLACTMPAQAARTTVPVQIDGERLQAVSYLERGVTYVPMRTFLESLGDWSIWWDAGAGEAAAVSGSTSLRADPAADTVTIRGKSYTGKVWVENGRTYIPLRIVITALGGQVAWDRYMSGAAVTSPGAEHDANTPSEKSLDAARQALNGVKPVGESLYFYAPALSQGAWITANRVYYTTIGGHRFYL